MVNEMKVEEGKIEDDLESNYSVSTQIIQQSALIIQENPKTGVNDTLNWSNSQNVYVEPPNMGDLSQKFDQKLFGFTF